VTGGLVAAVMNLVCRMIAFNLDGLFSSHFLNRRSLSFFRTSVGNKEVLLVAQRSIGQLFAQGCLPTDLQ